MKPAAQRIVLVLACGVALAALAVPVAAWAAPLGLSTGNVVTDLLGDADTGTPGDGAVFDITLGPSGRLTVDGVLTSVEIQGPSSIPQSNVTVSFALDFVSEASVPTPPFHDINATFNGPVAGPHFTIVENGNVVLTANFVPGFRVTGALNVTDPSASISADGTLRITGGNLLLVDALGGLGANLLFGATVFGFNPASANLLGDNVLYNSNFASSFAFGLAPQNAVAMTPEPGTAVLMGAGLLGLIGVARRRVARRR